MSRKTFHVEAYYTTFHDEPDLTAAELASRMRGWGFEAVDVEEEGEE